MTNFLCSGSQQIQSQSAYSVDEFSEMLQREANLNLNTATAISANLDQLDGAADGQITAQPFYDRRLLESAVDNQLCEVPSYKRLGLTSDTLGLVQSGCRYDEIDAAKLTLARYLNPNFVEPEPAPAVPVQKRVSERLVAEANNPFENIDFEVNEASADGVFTALLALQANSVEIAQALNAARGVLPADEVRTLEENLERLQQLRVALQGYFSAGTWRTLPEQVRTALANPNWTTFLTSSAQQIRTAVQSGTVLSRGTFTQFAGVLNSTRALLDHLYTLAAGVGNVRAAAEAAIELETLLASQVSSLAPNGGGIPEAYRTGMLAARQMPALRFAAAAAPQAESTIVELTTGARVSVSAAPQAVRVVAPTLEAFAAEAGAGVSEVRIVIDAVDDVVPAAQTRTVVAEAGPMVRAQAAPVVQSLRSAGFSGGPYTRPLLLVAGAAVLIGAGWYWLRDE